MGRDPYKYFRVEARELLDALSHGVLELERGSGGAELVVQMLRIAHTLKGAARVVRQGGIAEIAHAIEDLLAPHREKGSGPVSREHVDQILALLDGIASHLGALEAPQNGATAHAPTHEPPKTARTDESLQNVRVEIADMDALLEGVFETHVRHVAMRRDLEDLARARTLARALLELSPRGTRARAAAEELSTAMARAERNLTSGLDHADQETSLLRDRASQLRLLPANTVFPALERGVRDAAQSLRKAVRFETSGGEHRLEANVLFALRDALLHVVRNAVAHGVEPEAARLEAGKHPTGHVRLAVERRGNRIAFVCTDDGCGIDVVAVRRAVVASGVATEAAVAGLGAEQALRLVLESGVTTADRVTEVSGRGIGLDVLRNTVAQLKGEVTLATKRGEGTTVDVCVPLSVSSISALLVDAGDLTVSLPLDSVVRAFTVAANDIARSPERDSVVVEGVAVPFLPLATALRRPAAVDESARSWTAVVVHAGSRVAALGVDRLVGRSSVVVRPLPALAGAAPMVAGASLDAEGVPQLVLDPNALVETAHSGRLARASTSATGKTRPPVLVVDDSLTTRMLEQSILESAGYDVELATSAEEALAKARTRDTAGAYGLFLVDVEMPGMDGFEFVAKTRADPALCAIPAILVTSRDAPQDRRRGEEVGARAYIVKGEFDQSHLLRVIHQLIG